MTASCGSGELCSPPFCPYGDSDAVRSPVDSGTNSGSTVISDMVASNWSDLWDLPAAVGTTICGKRPSANNMGPHRQHAERADAVCEEIRRQEIVMQMLDDFDDEDELADMATSDLRSTTPDMQQHIPATERNACGSSIGENAPTGHRSIQPKITYCRFGVSANTRNSVDSASSTAYDVAEHGSLQVHRNHAHDNDQVNPGTAMSVSVAHGAPLRR